jgi:hypothetical protein
MYKETAINNRKCHPKTLSFSTIHIHCLHINRLSASFANTMLLLSQTQAKSALALKSIIKLNPAELHQALPTSDGSSESTAKSLSHKDRLRAALRGALGSKNHEADISDSQFLGRAASTPTSHLKADEEAKYNEDEGETVLPGAIDLGHNPVDEMYVTLELTIRF